MCLDIFACGIILFQMVFGVPPFEKASANDARYRYIIKSQYESFWKYCERNGKEITQEFKDLINFMLCYDPAQRITISEIKSHPWYKGKICSIEEIKEEYKTKEKQFLDYKAKKAQEMQEEKEKKKTNILMQPFSNTQPKPSFYMMQGITPTKYRSIEAALND